MTEEIHSMRGDKEETVFNQNPLYFQLVNFINIVHT
jgi:hypothetical protein